MKVLFFIFLLSLTGTVASQVTSINPQWIVEPEYDEIHYINDSTFLFSKEGLYGFARITGEIILRPQITKIISTSGWPLLVQIDNKQAFVNRDGKFITQEFYDEALDFSEGLAAVCKQGQWGYIDKQGTLVIPYHYKKASSFSNGYAVVDKSGYGIPTDYGYIDRTEKFILTAKDIKKNLKLKGQKISFSPFRDGVAVVTSLENLMKKYFLINKDLKVILYSDSEPRYIGHGVWLVPHSSNGLHTTSWKLMDNSGKWVSDAVYDRVKMYNEELAAVNINEKWGFINAQGQEIIPPQYQKVSDFSEGLAAVKKEEAWGYIDKQGKMVIPAIYSMASDFCNGKTYVEEWDYHYTRGMIIDKNGEICILLKDAPDAFYVDKYFSTHKKYRKVHLIRRDEERYKYYSDNFIIRGDNVSKNFIPVIKYGIMRAEPEESTENYVNRFVKESMEEWTKQGEFESKVDWNTRLQTQQGKMEQKFIDEALKIRYGTLIIGDNGFKLGKYDAEKQSYRIETNNFGSFDLRVKKDDAESFRTLWNNRKLNVEKLEYCIIEGKVQIAKVIFYEYNIGQFNYSITGNK